MRYVLLHFVDVDKQVHGSEFFAEVAAVESHAQYGFVKVLQFSQGKFFWQQVESERVLCILFCSQW